MSEAIPRYVVKKRVDNMWDTVCDSDDENIAKARAWELAGKGYNVRIVDAMEGYSVVWPRGEDL